MSLKAIVGRTGGKSKLRNKIRNMMPKHSTYVEPFVGGGSVFFAAPYDPLIKEVVNDKDKDIAQIYLDTKNVGDKYEGYTPVNKEGFKRLLNQKSFSSPLERLKRNIILSRQSFRADRKSFAPSKYNELMARGSSGQRQAGGLSKFKERLKNTRILNQDYKSVIRKYDSPTTLFYLDPPYSTAKKAGDYKDNDLPIEELINILKSIKGKFILSYDVNPLAKKLAREAGFKVMSVKTQYNAPPGQDIKDRVGNNMSMKTELIIRNY